MTRLVWLQIMLQRYLALLARLQQYFGVTQTFFISRVLSLGGARNASTSRDNTLRIWDTNTARPFLTLWQHGSQVQRVSWSQDVKLSASGTQIIRYVSDMQQPVESLRGYTQGYGAISRVFTRSIDIGMRCGSIRIWHMLKNKLNLLEIHCSMKKARVYGLQSATMLPGENTIAAGFEAYESGCWKIFHTQHLINIKWSEYVSGSQALLIQKEFQQRR